MGAIAEFYDDTPRIRLLEALVELSPVAFTASQAAEMFGEHRQTFYRLVDDFVKEGLLKEIKTDPRTFRVNEDDVRFRLMALNQGALELVTDSERDGVHPDDEILAKFEDSLDALVSEIDVADLSGSPGWGNANTRQFEIRTA